MYSFINLFVYLSIFVLFFVGSRETEVLWEAARYESLTILSRVLEEGGVIWGYLRCSPLGKSFAASGG